MVASGADDPFLYSNGTMKQLSLLPGGISGDAVGINNSGQIVGFTNFNASGQGAAVLYDSGVALNLNNLLDASGAGWTLYSATGINDNGWIVGDGTSPSGKANQSFLLIPVPEPSSVFLFLIGGMALGEIAMLSRRKGISRQE